MRCVFEAEHGFTLEQRGFARGRLLVLKSGGCPHGTMDAAYCSGMLHEHSHRPNHVPLIDHKLRGDDENEEFEPVDAIRYHERIVAERINARLKD